MSDFRYSERWFRLLLRLYPVDFRDQMGDALVETWCDRARAAHARGGSLALIGLWIAASLDSTWNGLGERIRPAVGWRRGGNWGRDMEHALRRLVRAPVFSLAILGTLTIGLGAFAVVFTMVQKVLLAPLPYREPDDLYAVWRNYTWFNFERGWLGGPDVVELAKSGGVIEAAAANLRYRVTLSGPGDSDPTEIFVLNTTPNLFDVLGAAPMLGTGFSTSEPTQPDVMVLSYGLWTRLGADSSIIGREFRLSGFPHKVIGVMPRDFRFYRNSSLGPAQPAPDAYIAGIDLARFIPDQGMFGGFIRVRPGTSPAAVAEQVAAVGRTIDARDFRSQGLKLYAVGIKSDLVARVRPALTVLGLAGGVLVLVLMVNLATLLLARAAGREREFAVSRALGANPVALVRATLLEGGLLGAAGGALGALAAVWGTRALVTLAPMDLPRRDLIAMDSTMALAIIGIGLLLGLLAAALPATWAARSSLAALLRNSAVRGGGARGRLRRGLVAMQVAMSLVLLTAGGLVARSFQRVLQSEPGFDPEGVLTLRVPIPEQVAPDTTTAHAIQQRIQAEMSTLPGVEVVSATEALPLSTQVNQTAIVLPGAPGNTGVRDHDRPLIDTYGVRVGYLEAMGIRLLAGRGFEDARVQGRHEALIDHTLAEEFFPGGSPLGMRVVYNRDTLTIVGVFQQARIYDLHQDSRGQVMVRAEDWGNRDMTFVLRTSRAPASLSAEARDVVRRIEPRLAVSDVRTMDTVVKDALRQQRISAVMITGFSLGALLLAAMGLFGVVSSAVARRRHELAVRLALGAEYGRILRLVLSDGARLILVGVAIGVPGAWIAGRAIRGTLVGVSPNDPLTLVVVGAALAGVALAACYFPARKVLGIEPARSLRDE
jgi:putative ABC transport system permease protein